MAMSGNFASGYGVPGNKYSPWLQLDWNITSQNVNTNKSYIDLTLWMRIEGYINYSSTMYGSLQGTGFSYSGNTGSYRWVKLSTKSIVVDHNRDGTGSVYLYASYNLKINFAGTNMREMSLSRTISLPTIPQASDVPHFSFNRELEVSTQNWIDLGTRGIVAKSSGFSHLVWLMDGKTTLISLGNISGGVRWIDLTPSQVNTIIRNMPSSSSKSLQLWVQTINSSGGYVGPHVLKSATATLHEDIKPSVSESLTLSIAGNGKDKAFNRYMKGISKVHGKFDGTAGYGASVSKYEFTVQQVAGTNVDRTTTSGKDITRPEVLKNSGQYEAWGRITDSRGRWTWVPADGSTVKFNVEDYVAPRLTQFQVKRTSPNTTVQITARGTWRYLSGQNRLRLTVKRRVVGTNSWTGVIDKYLNWTNNFNEVLTSRNNRADRSYEYTLELRDDYGNVVNATQTISTAKVLLDLHEDKGVGIGKVHEKGDLDIAGSIYTNGMRLDMAPKFRDVAPNATDTSSFWANLPQGTYKVGYGDFPGQPGNYGLIHVINDEDLIDWSVMFYAQGAGEQQIYRKHGNHLRNNPWETLTAQSGKTTRGEWIRFPDGTQICIGYNHIPSGSWSTWGNVWYKYADIRDWVYPIAFIRPPTFYASADGGAMWFGTSSNSNSRAGDIQAYRPTATNNTSNTGIRMMAVGRWYL